MLVLRIVWMILLGLSLPLTSFAQVTASQWYQKGDFDKAILAYESQISDDFQNSSILFNLGNSYYKSDQKGKAMAAYLKAQQLSPRDPDVKANLSFLTSRLKDDVAVPKGEFAVHTLTLSEHLSLKEIFGISVLCFLLGGISWGYMGFFEVRPVYAVFGQVFLLPGLIFFFMTLMRMQLAPQIGAVSAEQVEVLASPSNKNGVVVFQLNEGAPVAILENIGEWYRIELFDKKRGWVKSEEIMMF